MIDLRKGIDGLATIIGDQYHQNPFEKGTIFFRRKELTFFFSEYKLN